MSLISSGRPTSDPRHRLHIQTLLILKLSARLPIAAQMAEPDNLRKHKTMHTLYDSETYSVTHVLANAVVGDAPEGSVQEGKPVPVLARHGFEIVDKRSGKEVYLDGSWAELFQQHIQAWQVNTPTQEEVEDTLEGYAELAQNPVLVH